MNRIRVRLAASRPQREHVVPDSLAAGQGAGHPIRCGGPPVAPAVMSYSIKPLLLAAHRILRASRVSSCVSPTTAQ